MQYFSDSITTRFHTLYKSLGDDDCWLWNAGKTKDGYGLFYVHSFPGSKRTRVTTAHRYMKEIEAGTKFPRSLEASHLCKNRSCVNPKHIVMESHTENMARRNYKMAGLGVSWLKQWKRWRAYYKEDGKQIHVGNYENFCSAILARRQAIMMKGRFP